jgi:hypothetical protein
LLLVWELESFLNSVPKLNAYWLNSEMPESSEFGNDLRTPSSDRETGMGPQSHGSALDSVVDFPPRFCELVGIISL